MNPAVAKANKTKLIWGLICLIGPTVLIIATILGYALVNFLVGSTTQPTGDDGFAQASLFVTATNIIMYLVGTIGVLGLLPGIVIGIVLLATRK